MHRISHQPARSYLLVALFTSMAGLVGTLEAANTIDPDAVGATDVVRFRTDEPAVLLTNPLPDPMDLGFDLLGVGFGDATQGSPGHLRVDSGSRTSSIAIFIGVGDGSTGTVEASGSGTQFSAVNGIFVGNLGQGSLIATDGARTGSGVLVIGNGPASAGIATFSGAATEYIGADGTAASDESIIAVGAEGAGALNVLTGARAEAAQVFVGSINGSTGVANVNGTGSELLADLITVGSEGDGTLKIRNQAFVGGRTFRPDLIVADMAGSEGDVFVNSQAGLSTSDATIGRSAGSDGLVWVSEIGTTWEVRDDLEVGGAGGGQVIIDSGGRVIATEGTDIGNLAGGIGRVRVEGALSQWTNTGTVFVGKGGQGEALLSSGASATSPSTWLGLESGSSGGVTLEGSGTAWASTIDFTVGNLGEGTLNVTDGALLAVGNQLFVGREQGSIGEVNVGLRPGQSPEDGNAALSRLQTGAIASQPDPDLEIGFAGTGVFNQTTGTTSVGQDLILGNQSTGNGTLNLSGGTITVTSFISVGDSGTGVVEISGDAVLRSTTSSLRIGTSSAAASGVVTLTENASLATGNFDIQVGFVGSGTLNVADTAMVNAPDDLFIGNGSDSVGRVNQTGGTVNLGSPTAMGDIVIGFASSDAAYDHSGGQLTATGGVTIAQEEGSAGTVNLSGSAVADITRSYTVGSRGSANLSVSEGGRLTIGNHLYLGLNADGVGEAAISGDAEVNVGDEGNFDLAIGNGGSGKLTVSEDAMIGISDDLVVARNADSDGEVTISGGEIAVGTTSGHAGRSIFVGLTGDGTYTQTGGTVTAQEDLYISRNPGATGSLSISGGSLSVRDVFVKQNNTNAAAAGQLTVSGAASVEATGDILFSQGSTFDQEGGSLTVGGSVSVGASLGATAVAEISGGTTEIADDFFIGAVSANGQAVSGGPGQLTISGGKVLVGDDLRVFEGSTLAITGGHVTAADLRVGSNNFSFTDGVLEIGFFIRGSTTAGNVFEQTGGTLDVLDSTRVLQLQDYDLQAGALSVQLGEVADGTDFVFVTGDLMLGSESILEIGFNEGFVPELGDVFSVLSAANLSGEFGHVSTPDLGSLAIELVEVEVQGTVPSTLLRAVVVPAIEGDYNTDGIVNAADYTVWRDTLGQTGAGLAADANLDGEVTTADFDAWRSNYGATLPPSAAFSRAVPEPSSMLLMALSAATVFFHRSLGRNGRLAASPNCCTRNVPGIGTRYPE